MSEQEAQTKEFASARKTANAQIAILPRHLVNQIAAGEVIERPGSAVKELVDNAIDAGAHKIQVHIMSADARNFRVIDDGIGIPLDQLDLAFTVHATSKITSLDDLNMLSTMGFRGEALASIHSVSQIICESKHISSPEAYKVSLDFHGNKTITASRLLKGTAMEVLDLFGNVPVRLKFMKKPEAEAQHAIDIVRELALANPDISFELIVGKKLHFRTGGSDNWEQTALEVFPDKPDFKYIEVSRNDPYIELQGLIAPLSQAKTNRRYQIMLVNRRPVKCPVLLKAVKDVYHGFLPAQRYPSLILSLHLSPEDLDINVHPTKREIRYSRPDLVYKLVMLALEKQLILGSSLNQSPLRQDHPLEITPQDFRNTEAQTAMKLEPAEPEFKSSENFTQGKLVEKETFTPLFTERSPLETAPILSRSESTSSSAIELDSPVKATAQNLIRGLEIELKQLDQNQKTNTYHTHLGQRSEFCLQQGSLVLHGAVSGERKLCDSLVARLNDWLFELDLKGIDLPDRSADQQTRFLPKVHTRLRPKLPLRELEAIWERDGWLCVYCGKHLLHPALVKKALRKDPESWVEWLDHGGMPHKRHILREHQASHDHYLPYDTHPSLAKNPDQLLSSCRVCNQSKSNSTDYNRWKPHKFTGWSVPQKIGKLIFDRPDAKASFHLEAD